MADTGTPKGDFIADITKLLQDAGPLAGDVVLLIQDLVAELNTPVPVTGVKAAAAKGSCPCPDGCSCCDHAIKLQVKALSAMLKCKCCCS